MSPDVSHDGPASGHPAFVTFPEIERLPAFVAFPKIARLRRDMVVSEKIDGTNAVVYVGEDGRVLAGSRHRWLVAPDDNYGFARWVQVHADELRALGVGYHYGEWWGHRIQRGYGLPPGDRRFALFDTERYREADPPACCSVVPVLYRGPFSTGSVFRALDDLASYGSHAQYGFMRPEGVVVYLPAARVALKVSLEHDEPRSAGAAARRQP